MKTCDRIGAGGAPCGGSLIKLDDELKCLACGRIHGHVFIRRLSRAESTMVESPRETDYARFVEGLEMERMRDEGYPVHVIGKMTGFSGHAVRDRLAIVTEYRRGQWKAS